MTSTHGSERKTYLRPAIADLGTLADITRGRGQVPPVHIGAGIGASVDVHVTVTVDLP